MPMSEEARGSRKVRSGVVMSDAMDKTRVVKVERQTSHPLYGKRLLRTKKYKVHDEANESHVGDTVEMMETRPLSKDKRWRLVRIVEKAK
jgi:small subunit ribosomal protein S17